MNNYTVIWRGGEIGSFESGQPDMWYLEGKWISNNSSLANDFHKEAKKLNPRDVMNDLTLGLRISLVDTETDTDTMHAVIYSLDGNMLFVRVCYDKELIDWVLQNVK